MIIVWGCIVMLLVLGLDFWGWYKYIVVGKVDMLIIFVLGVLNLFISFWGVVDDVVDYVRMLFRFGKLLILVCYFWG